MKKLLISAMAIACVGLVLTSCSSDEPLNGGDGSGKITFTAQLPAELGSRAFGDGTTANTLSYYVYKHGDKTVLMTGSTDINLSATVPLELVNGETYDVVFLAQSSSAPEGLYSYASDTQNFTVDYTKAVQNNENCDAFYAVKTVTVAGGTTEEVDLYRPFAQVNFGTDDATQKVVTSAYGENLARLNTTLYMKADMPNVLNLVSGELSGNSTVNFTAAGVPSQTEFPAGPNPMDGYRYLSMNYVLASANENDVNDLTFTVMRGEEVMNTISVPNAPMRANYQTNIYGSLLTSSTDFTVTIQPAFAGNAGNIQYWDGTVKTPVVNEEAKTVSINTPAEFAGFAKMVNDGNKLDGYTVTLENDIDLANQPWTPVGGGQAQGEGGFYGVFDGKNHTVSNLNCVATGDKAVAGLFGSITGMVKNVNVENANVSSDHYAGGVVAYVYKMLNLNDGKEFGVKDCTVNGGKIVSNFYNGDNGDKVGGVVGGVWQGGATISGNKASNLTVQGYRHVGGVIGWMDWTTSLPAFKVSGNTADNVTIIQDLGTNYNNITPSDLIGAVVGATQKHAPGQTATPGGVGISGSIATNVHIILKNYTAEGPVSINAGGYSKNFDTTGVASLTLDKMDVTSICLGLRTPVTISNCTITKAAVQPAGSDRYGMFFDCLIPNKVYNLTITNTTIKSSWGHGIFIQGSAETAASVANVINITGCSFSNWGEKEKKEADITTSCAFKTIRTGNFATVAASKAWADAFIKNNTFDAATLATGRKHCALGSGDQPSFYF